MMEFSDASHSTVTLSRMEGHLDRRQLCDVTLIVGDKKIPTHKLVLSSTSDYFQAMFNNNLRESNQNEVEIRDIDPDALEELIKYMYSGKIEIREDNVEHLLATASVLQLVTVVNWASDFLKRQLHASNCLGIHSFADTHNCVDLKSAAHEYTMEHFIEVTQNHEFLQLPSDKITNLISSDEVNVPKEEDMFVALMAWMQHDVEERKHHLPRLLGYIRLTHVSKEFLADQVHSNALVKDSLACQHQVVISMIHHMLPERSPSNQPARKSTSGTLFAIGGMDSGKGAATVEQFVPRLNKWDVFTTMTGRRLQFGVAVLDEKLFLVGGRDGLKTLNSVECFNPRTKSWNAMPPVGTHRHGLGVAVLNGPMYAVGGHDGWSYLNTVERWDPQARTWNYVAPMGLARSTLGVAVLLEKLYAVGGRDGCSCIRSVECFDPHTNKWTACAPMLKRRGGVGVGVCGGCMYAIGGHDAPASSQMSRLQESVERYDPKTDQWTIVAPMSVPRDAVGICVLGGRLYACGGFDGQSYLETCESYSPETNEWTYEASLNTGRAGTVVVHMKSLS